MVFSRSAGHPNFVNRGRSYRRLWLLCTRVAGGALADTIAVLIGH